MVKEIVTKLRQAPDSPPCENAASVLPYRMPIDELRSTLRGMMDQSGIKPFRRPRRAMFLTKLRLIDTLQA
ncbi:MAG: hypothetical protein WDN46_25470 [Methylocella sp.]